MLVRKIYKRGHSYATNLPREAILGLKSIDYVSFEFVNGKWYLDFKKRKGMNIFSRKVLKGSSFGITLPSVMLFRTKKKSVEFVLEKNKWRMKIE